MIRRKYMAAISTALCLSLCACSSAKPDSEPVDVTPAPTTETPTTEAPTTEAPTAPPIEPVTIDLVSIGDMLMHAGASLPAVQADGSFNYDYLFTNVADAIQGADLAIVNNEVIMGGNELGNIGYPNFNIRTELADAEVRAGFDVVLSATNHTLDQHMTGLNNTINYWKTNFPHISLLGVHDSKEHSENITVREIEGIKIALLNYTYGLNGYSLPAGSEYAIDLMTDSTRSKVMEDIRKAEELADFVIVFPHWGIEYTFQPTEEQKNWASLMTEAGADLIIGTHPHVIQPVEWVTSANGNKSLVYYSLGNFVSIQYHHFAMLGGMADVSITKDETGTYVSSHDMEFLVTHYTSGRTAVTTYYLDDYTEEFAASHAIHVEPGPQYDSINREYPFTVARLKELAKEICPEFVDW